MVALDVDFEVFKALTNRRIAESVSYNDVLRDILGLPEEFLETSAQTKGWSWKGVFLPDGTELKTQHKGTAYTAKIENGKWIQEEKLYNSPSAAAFSITGHGINGWWFWFVKRPDDPAWMPLGKLRN